MDTPRVTPHGEAQGPALRSLESSVSACRRVERDALDGVVIPSRRAEAAQPPSTVAQRPSKVRNTSLEVDEHVAISALTNDPKALVVCLAASRA